MGAELILILGGDVMTRRGVDQILPYPGDCRLRDSHISDARTYVSLAEAKNGPIPRPVTCSWPWGDALQAVEEIGPAARLINLETSITTSEEAAPGKEVHYRMGPDNLGCLTTFSPAVCVLANNHVLDFGRVGLLDTLAALRTGGLQTAGLEPIAARRITRRSSPPRTAAGSFSWR
jgi:poly-gamma-glutamate capsule biosynthesis protein CapA/YwtB (metallophosphatase superfamily)